MEQQQSVPSVRVKLWGLPRSWSLENTAGTRFLLREQLLFIGQAMLFLAFLAVFTFFLPSLSKTCVSMAKKM